MLQGYHRRGAALTALCCYEEALSAFCACAALDRNPQAARGEVTRVLHRLLTARVGPWANLKAARAYTWRPPPTCSSDCEDNSSDDDCESRAQAQAQAQAQAVRGGGRGRGPAGARTRGQPQHQHQHQHSAVGVDISASAPTDPHLDTLLDRVFQDVEKLRSECSSSILSIPEKIHPNDSSKRFVDSKLN